MEHWYVYYKLPADELDRQVPVVRALLDAVARASGVQPLLQTRLDVVDGIATVMEIYPDIAEPARFGARLDAALRASALPEAVRSGRRTERFRSL